MARPPFQGQPPNMNPYNAPLLSQTNQDLLKKSNSPSAFRPPIHAQSNPGVANNLHHHNGQPSPSFGQPSPSFNQPNSGMPGGHIPPMFRGSPHSSSAGTPPPPRNINSASMINTSNSYNNVPPLSMQNNSLSTNSHHTPPSPNISSQPHMLAPPGSQSFISSNATGHPASHGMPPPALHGTGMPPSIPQPGHGHKAPMGPPPISQQSGNTAKGNDSDIFILNDNILSISL